MPCVTLKKYTDNSTIFEGNYLSIKNCLESAVEKGVCLSHINLKNQNLTNANLDCCSMPYANLSGANLTGANLSEADVSNAIFFNSSLYNACLSYTNLKNCDFRGASFGATLINGANLKGCSFSTLSCMDMELQHAVKMTGCKYVSPDGETYNMSTPPIIVKGLLSVPVIVFDDVIKIGAKTFSKNRLPQLSNILGFYAQKIVA